MDIIFPFKLYTFDNELRRSFVSFPSVSGFEYNFMSHCTARHSFTNSADLGKDGL